MDKELKLYERSFQYSSEAVKFVNMYKYYIELVNIVPGGKFEGESYIVFFWGDVANDEYWNKI